MSTYDKQEILDLLKSHTLQITFTKVDGTQRVMDCTLRESVLPAAKSTTAARKEKPVNVLAVWSVKDAGWRSIKLESISNVRVLASV